MSSGPFSGNPTTAVASPASRRGERQRVRGRDSRRAARPRRSCRRRARPRPVGAAPAPPACTLVTASPGDDVGVGDDEVRGGDPARALDPVAAGHAGHAHRPRARGDDLRIPREMPDPGTRTSASGPRIWGSGLSWATARVRSSGGIRSFQHAHDPRILHRGVQAREHGRLEGEDADGPDQHERERRARGPPPQGRRARPRPGSCSRLAQRASDGPRDDLPEHREDQDADQRDPRPVERVLVLRYKQGRQPRSHRSPHNDPDQREDPGKETRPRAAHHDQDHEERYQEIHHRHRTGFYNASTLGLPAVAGFQPAAALGASALSTLRPAPPSSLSARPLRLRLRGLSAKSRRARCVRPRAPLAVERCVAGHEAFRGRVGVRAER